MVEGVVVFSHKPVSFLYVLPTVCYRLQAAYLLRLRLDACLQPSHLLCNLTALWLLKVNECKAIQLHHSVPDPIIKL